MKNLGVLRDYYNRHGIVVQSGNIGSLGDIDLGWSLSIQGWLVFYYRSEEDKSVVLVGCPLAL